MVAACSAAAEPAPSEVRTNGLSPDVVVAWPFAIGCLGAVVLAFCELLWFHISLVLNVFELMFLNYGSRGSDTPHAGLRQPSNKSKLRDGVTAPGPPM